MEPKEILSEKIESVLSQNVRPSLRSHGGDVLIDEIEGDVLKVKLIGACSSCPSAYLTTEQLIEEEVVSAVPEIKKVVLVQDLSEELLDQARRILGQK